ncbi:uncharacterized protein JCM6883_006554 [Sporobolomyces salmoneus]|uniref:uncharacterized protein n=1 Tax=Sporobolomyces salmoneus TaxID=183962 RepID=UPI00317B4DF8
MSTPSLTPSEIALIPSPSLPITPQLTHLLTSFLQLSLQLFSLLSNPSSQPNHTAQITSIYAALAEIDHKLSSLLSLIAQHQERQSRINQLLSSLSSLSSTSSTSTSLLSSSLSSLSPLIASGHLDRQSISSSTSSPLSSSSILSYARLLAPFTSAPPSSLFPPGEKLRGAGMKDPTGRSLPIGSLPPFPTEGIMRRGRLQFGREFAGDGLGQTGEIGARTEGHELHPSVAPTTNGASGAGATGGETMERLQYEAKQYESSHQAHAGSANFASSTNSNGVNGAENEGEEEEEEFEFDLDLNPDV